MKKFTSLILILTLVIMAFAGCESKPKESPASDFEYEINDGKVTITRYIGKDANVVIPAQIDGKAVTVIGKNAFMMLGVTTVVLPNSIEKIDDYAFQDCHALTQMKFPASLKTIGINSFNGCKSLSELPVLPDALESIGLNAFKDCIALIEVTIPGDCLLGNSAFEGSGLQKITFEEGIETIPECFLSGTQLSEINLPGSVKTIKEYAFANCDKLQNVRLNDGLEIISGGAFNSSKIEQITIPSSVIEISERVFLHCNSLKQVYFEGDAPSCEYLYDEAYRSDFLSFLPEYTIYYHEGAEGFTSSEWNGYKTQIW